MAVEKKAPAVPKEPKVKKPTKKDLAAELRLIKNFENMCGSITSTTTGFIKTNVEALNRVTLSEDGKKTVATLARKVSQELEANPKVALPVEWDALLTLDQN